VDERRVESNTLCALASVPGASVPTALTRADGGGTLQEKAKWRRRRDAASRGNGPQHLADNHGTNAAGGFQM
jgi:hypothetical protein